MLSPLIIVLVLGRYQQVPPKIQNDSPAIGSLGITAYERGDYGTAFSLLRSAVNTGIVDGGSISAIDPWSAVYLSRMYLRGEATMRDPALACALFRAAVNASDAQAHDLNAASKFRRVIGQDPCEPSSEGFDAEVMALLNGCLLSGIGRFSFNVENGIVQLDRTGIHVDINGVHRDQSLSLFSDCSTETISVASVSLAPRDTRPTRYFMSVFTRSMKRPARSAYRELRWNLIEVDKKGAHVVVAESLGALALEPCPHLNCAEWLAQAVRLEPRGDHRVSWRLVGFDKSGVFD